MSKPAVILAAAILGAAVAGCASGSSSSHSASPPPAVTVCGFLKTGGLEAGVTMPGEVTAGESVTLEAYNPGRAVRLVVTDFTVGGYQGVSGNTAGPDDILVGKALTIPARTGNMVNLGTFPVSDPGLENVPGSQLLEAVDGTSLGDC